MFNAHPYDNVKVELEPHPNKQVQKTYKCGPCCKCIRTHYIDRRTELGNRTEILSIEKIL